MLCKGNPEGFRTVEVGVFHWMQELVHVTNRFDEKSNYDPTCRKTALAFLWRWEQNWD